MLATYMRRMRNNKLEVSIAGSSSRPQLLHNYAWQEPMRMITIIIVITTYF